MIDDHETATGEGIPGEQRRKRRGLVFWMFGTWSGRSLLSVMALSTIGAVGLLVTGALLTDEVTMATVTTTGGTLDITANGEVDDTAVAYNGTSATITTDVSNMKPGDTAWGDVTIDNTGTLPLTLTVTQTGSDTHPDDANHCFSYYFRLVSAVGATQDAAAAYPVQIGSMGTDETTDAGTVLFETGVAAASLYDITSTSEAQWETDDTKTYRLHVRMRTECEQGGDPNGTLTAGAPTAATGTLNFRFDAAQV